MKIKDLPESSQPRKRFLKHGVDALSDAELFAIILRTGTVGENIIEMSNKLISKFGLVNLFDCSLKEIQEIKGIGQNKAMQILAIAKLGERYSQEKHSTSKINCAKDVFKFFHAELKNKKKEKFIALYLDNKNKILKEETLSIGTIDEAIVHPREVFRRAIKEGASSMILVHNHPSGDPTPSEEDIEITKGLMEASEVLGVKLLDHIIVGRENYWSWRERKD